MNKYQQHGSPKNLNKYSENYVQQTYNTNRSSPGLGTSNAWTLGALEAVSWAWRMSWARNTYVFYTPSPRICTGYISYILYIYIFTPSSCSDIHLHFLLPYAPHWASSVDFNAVAGSSDWIPDSFPGDVDVFSLVCCCWFSLEWSKMAIWLKQLWWHDSSFSVTSNN